MSQRRRDSPPPYSEVETEFQSSSDLVIGIDFGTTFTGVAFFYSENTSHTDISRVAENVNVIKTWPSPSFHFSEKTPTIIAYNTIPPTWGGNVKPKHEPQVAHFKLGLQPNVGGHYLQPDSRNASNVLGFLSTENWTHPKLPGKHAVDFTADYLSCLHTYLKEVFLPTQFGSVLLRNQQISYVITVPAIWKDVAKARTREAALRAGIPGRKLTFVTEPEAAALYCATLCKEVDLKDGDRFLICDAGGGTVDLISYKVKSREPFKIEECNIGSGAACGSIYLDKGFETLLRNKLGRQGDSILTEKRLAESQRHFDSSIKRQYNPYDDHGETEFEIPLTGAPDLPDVGLEEGYLTLSKAEIQTAFDPVFSKILSLIQKQIEDVQTKCYAKMKTLFLVGGLGSNLYLFEFLSRKLVNRIEVKQPVSGYGAIMRGAVLYKMGLNVVKERIMRRSYGVRADEAFRDGYHPEFRKYTDIDGIDRCKGTWSWYAAKGEKMEHGTAVQHFFAANFTDSEYRLPGPLERSIPLDICEDDVPPEYDYHGVTELCKVSADLRNIPASAFEKRFGPKGVCYQVHYHIAITFGPELTMKLLYQGKVMGTAVAKYS